MSEMRILEGCRQETKDAVSKILATFGGEDGGASFHRLCCLVNDMDRKAVAGDLAAATMIQMVMRMARLIDAANANY